MLKLIDMRRTPEDKAESVLESMPMAGPINVDDYPPGLSISLTEDELEKLDLDDDVDVGDMIDLRAFAKVTSVSKHERNGKTSCRVELQLTMLGFENETTEEPGEGY
jgi:hypothetical protein